MFRAGSARSCDLPAQCLARSEHSHGRIVARDAGLGRIVFDGEAIDLDAAEGSSVFRLERPGELTHALTYRSAHVLRSAGAGLKFSRERCRAAISRSPAAVMIDYGIAKHTVEPCDGRFFAAQLVRTVEPACKCLLEDVLGDLSIANALLEKCKELTVIFDQSVDYVWRIMMLRSLWRVVGHVQSSHWCHEQYGTIESRHATRDQL